MTTQDINMLSNAELRLLLNSMENEYEALKTTVQRSVEKMDALDKKYVETKELLTKRTRGKI
jgi:hypothetical protein